MKPEEFADAQQLWKMYYAQQCFQQCEAAAQYIADHKLEPEDALSYPLLTAVYVLYGKPFKHAYGGVGKLGTEIIPEAHQGLHTVLIQHRDQLYAHRDATPKGIPSSAASRVVFRVTAQRYGFYATDFRARHPLMLDVVTLCKILREKTGYHIDRICRKHRREISKSEGDFLLNIYDHKGQFLERLPKEDRQ